jgi:hypothetical protein
VASDALLGRRILRGEIPEQSAGIANTGERIAGYKIGGAVGIARTGADIVDVREDLIANTDDMVMQLGRGRAPCKAGKQFGLRYPGKPAETAVYDFLPDEQLRGLSNLTDFLGILVFDK